MVARTYNLTFEKTLTNVGNTPIERLTYWVFANKFPDDPEQSARFYQAFPLRWADLNFRAWDDSGDLDVRVLSDTNARKEFSIVLKRGECVAATYPRKKPGRFGIVTLCPSTSGDRISTGRYSLGLGASRVCRSASGLGYARRRTGEFSIWSRVCSR